MLIEMMGWRSSKRPGNGWIAAGSPHIWRPSAVVGICGSCSREISAKVARRLI
jgi:hypothetical protein